MIIFGGYLLTFVLFYPQIASCGSSLVNMNHYWETKFASYFTIIYHDLHQNTIYESCLTIVIVKMSIE